MTKVVVIADLVAKPEHATEVKDILLSFIKPTRQEEGCLTYELNVDNENPNHFLMYENWTTAELLQQHSKGKALVAGLAKLGELVETVTLSRMTVVEA